MYHAIGLLQANSDFSIAQAETPAEASPAGPYGHFRWQSNPHRARRLVDGPGTGRRARAASGDRGAREQAGRVGAGGGGCLRRVRPAVEVWTDLPDPFMEHFNAYLSVVEVLKSFRGLLAVDPKEPGVL